MACLFVCLFAAALPLALPLPQQRACAGKTVFGLKGSNTCPAGSYVIVDVAECQSAAAAAGQRYFGTVGSNFPRGCSLATVVQLSTDATGTANPNMQPLCAVGTGPLAECAFVCACASERACDCVCVRACVCVCL